MPKRACCFAIFIGSYVMASDGKGISGVESFVYGDQLCRYDEIYQQEPRTKIW